MRLFAKPSSVLHFRFALPTALLFVAALGSAAKAAPADDLLASLQATADVNDFAGVLSTSERQMLENRCRELRSRVGAQLAVVTLKTLQGGQIDDFAEKLFRKWGVGQGGKDNGVLLLVAIEDRRARIEVGYGLEGVLPDVLAGRILQEQLFPAFREQRYAAGLTAAVNRIAEIVERGEPAAVAGAEEGAPPPEGLICLLPFFLLFTVFPSIMVGASLREKQVQPALFTAGFVGFAYFMAIGFGLPLLAYLLLIPADIAAGIFGYYADVQAMERRRRRYSSGPLGGWTWGGTGSGSSWSGGGFGGGSWGGFGGGGSGGGGASGGW